MLTEIYSCSIQTGFFYPDRLTWSQHSWLQVRNSSKSSWWMEKQRQNVALWGQATNIFDSKPVQCFPKTDHSNTFITQPIFNSRKKPAEAYLKVNSEHVWATQYKRHHGYFISQVWFHSSLCFLLQSLYCECKLTFKLVINSRQLFNSCCRTKKKNLICFQSSYRM